MLLYSLMEKRPTKGELGLTELASTILFADSEAERSAAMRAAAASPEAFKLIASKFPGQPPNSGTMVAFLCRNNYTADAAKKVVKLYLESYTYLRSTSVSDGSDIAPQRSDHHPESSVGGADEKTTGGSTMNTLSAIAAPRPGDFTEVLRGTLGRRIFKISANGPLSKAQWKDIKAYIDISMAHADDVVADDETDNDHEPHHSDAT